jgi:hypothetical protein
LSESGFAGFTEQTGLSIIAINESSENQGSDKKAVLSKNRPKRPITIQPFSHSTINPFE